MYLHFILLLLFDAKSPSVQHSFFVNAGTDYWLAFLELMDDFSVVVMVIRPMQKCKHVLLAFFFRLNASIIPSE